MTPHRRLKLDLDLEADDLDELHHALVLIANDLAIDGRESRAVTSGGYTSGYVLTLTCDEGQTGDQYREQNARWVAEQREASDA